MLLQDVKRKFQKVEAVKNNDYPDEVVSAGQLLRILDSDAREISTLCQRACLRPKKDGFGNIYFSKSDVDVLRKVKELYERSRRTHEKKSAASEVSELIKGKEKKEEMKIEMKDYAQAKALPQKNELFALDTTSVQGSYLRKLDIVENNVVERLTEVLSEKLDGLDEVIVELIKAKTENETLRQKVNELNKENFTLKNENASFKAVGLGFYIKKSTDDFIF